MLDVALGERHSEMVGFAELVVVHFLRKDERIDFVVKLTGIYISRYNRQI